MATGNRFPVPKTPEERAEYVAAAFENCSRPIAPYIKQLRCDFRALKSGATIMGCKTWTEFCVKVLKRTDRAIRYVIAGGNPRSKRTVETKLGPKEEPESKDDWQNHWKGMPEFIQDDLTPFKTIHVHFEKQKDVDKFAKLVGQKITPQTRYIYYPERQKDCYVDKAYLATDPDESRGDNSGSTMGGQED
jgi:hypothetical protein